MDERWFRTSSGRQVRLSALQVQDFNRGYLEGRAFLIREQVLAELPDTARRMFPGRAGVLVGPCDGPADRYPALVYFCEFECSQAVGPGGDCSALIAVWFADDMTRPVPEFVAIRIGGVDWERHAVDGWH